MKIRAAVHLGADSSSLQIYPVLQETADHLVMKLAACLFYHAFQPLIVTSPQQQACLRNQEFWPDLLAVDAGGQATLWVECGKTTIHKLDKVTKRFRDARIIVLTAQPREGEQMAKTLDTADNPRVEVWSFPEGAYARWRQLVLDQNDIIGEATESSLNLVINSQPYMTELRRIR